MPEYEKVEPSLLRETSYRKLGYPGSESHIPKIAEITFKEELSRDHESGKAYIIKGYLDVGRHAPLTIFPHREWNCPVDTPIKCVLFPVRRSAVAIPYDDDPIDSFIPVTQQSLLKKLVTMMQGLENRIETLENSGKGKESTDLPDSSEQEESVQD